MLVTGNGLKDVNAAMRACPSDAPTIDPDLAALRAVLSQREEKP